MSVTCLIRFLDVIRGSRIAAPSKLLPVIKIPLGDIHGCKLCSRWPQDMQRVHLPGCSQHGKPHAKPDPHCTPEVRRDVHKQKSQVLPVDPGVASGQHESGCRHCRHVVRDQDSVQLVWYVGTMAQVNNVKGSSAGVSLGTAVDREQHELRDTGLIAQSITPAELLSHD